MNVVRVAKDRDWLARCVPVLQRFYAEIDTYRRVGIDNHPRYADYVQQ
jgi:hypothetical protein